MNPKKLLLIFTRNPELGKCKTRLAATVGDAAALAIYKFLLAHTVGITQDLRLTKAVYYSDAIWENDLWDEKKFEKKLQHGNDLGERMAHAFKEGFDSGFDQILIIGSDMYDLCTSDIEEAFLRLNHSDYVLGPAQDGGYYLLGMKTYNSRLFQHKKWGTETVLTDTMKDLENQNVSLLPQKNDIDVYDDIKDIPDFKPFLKNKT
ncbi:TIGR04282 family arsenosugar biosynthesis glycosyltransferase [Arenibacter sp. GZD96]|uniref:TIGR04282 family arsenosugar biosynthesis glycosyltransferase n=1 Tax=Aurantibrevibacter litoralis TaxID=3106030 RepID=UPI002AFF5D77|nr:TIGR04282 family arsenosugar biosynthesis glycosyltransferase [Arenibacter sp. GZD-96]MEA1785586.1 TIGR04282 family arsenosugar biosynthesis glycosyltransferase [Arenibacter sp. GZD-96]